MSRPDPLDKLKLAKNAHHFTFKNGTFLGLSHTSLYARISHLDSLWSFANSS